MNALAAPYRNAPWLFLSLLAVGVVGFYPSYFSRLGDTDLPHHFHGVMATLWMIFLVLQASLARSRKMQLHRQIGKASYVVVPLFLCSGVLMIHTMLRGTDPFSQAFGVRLALIDATTLAYFALAYLQAIRHKRNVHLHARHMATTGLMILPPALARLVPALVPSVHSFEAAFHLAYLFAELVVLALLLADLRPGRPRAPFAVLLLFLAVQQLGFHLMSAPGVA